jgi:hypothetical protein
MKFTREQRKAIAALIDERIAELQREHEREIDTRTRAMQATLAAAVDRAHALQVERDALQNQVWALMERQHKLLDALGARHNVLEFAARANAACKD